MTVLPLRGGVDRGGRGGVVVQLANAVNGPLVALRARTRPNRSRA
ncbi:hypothetical protein AB0M19_29325 [Streptomyces sp. NPDC051920]